MNPYETLGVAKDATGDDIHKAYRRLAKTAHPDAGGTPERWEKLQLAYAVLGDDAARAKYDATGDITLGSPNNELSEVLSILTVAFEHVREIAEAHRAPLRAINLKSALRQQLEEDRKERAKQVADMNRLVLDLRGRLVRRKGVEGPDIFALLVSHYERLAELSAKRSDEIDKWADRALTELDFYVDTLAMRLEDKRSREPTMPRGYSLGSIFDP